MRLRRRYPGREAFKREVASTVRNVLEESLSPLNLAYDLWEGVAEEGKGIEPVRLFGTEVVPDLAVNVAGRPTLALTMELVRHGDAAASRLATALGRALVCAHSYPAVLAFIYYPDRAAEYPQLLERELAMGLWSTYKVRLLVR